MVKNFVSMFCFYNRQMNDISLYRAAFCPHCVSIVKLFSVYSFTWCFTVNSNNNFFVIKIITRHRHHVSSVNLGEISSLGDSEQFFSFATYLCGRWYDRWEFCFFNKFLYDVMLIIYMEVGFQNEYWPLIAMEFQRWLNTVMVINCFRWLVRWSIKYGVCCNHCLFGR